MPREWFRKFCENNFNLSDTTCPGRPAETDNGEILELIKSDRYRTIGEIEEILGINQLINQQEQGDYINLE
ncbi:hypothetical protein HZH66_013989 [Vespula vulgaris]|uniref:Uncharacterized protein n=1 Tax=Vespula vulgaris TaxID=7454 RepID=A0A834J4Y3_VESVU|nr:hypothetical protein HZH66_013989 [Vespula vulgaris]